MALFRVAIGVQPALPRLRAMVLLLLGHSAMAFNSASRASE